MKSHKNAGGKKRKHMTWEIKGISGAFYHIFAASLSSAESSLYNLLKDCEKKPKKGFPQRWINVEAEKILEYTGEFAVKNIHR